MWNKVVKFVRNFIEPAEYYDYNLLAVIILLVGFGLVILYSASAYDAATSSSMNYNSMGYLIHQAPISIFSVVVCIICSRFDYHILPRFAGIFYIFSLALMCLVRTGMGVTVNGARRWLKIGPIQFQPSEVVKLAVIIFIPVLIIGMGRKVNTLKGFIFLFIAGIIIPGGGAYFLTDNLSTGLIIAAISAGLIFISHPKTMPFLIAIGALFVVAVIFVIYVKSLNIDASSASSFRFTRILTWLEPEKYSQNSAYQTVQGLYAIGSGGFFGKGLGNSIQKLGSIPEAQNDMIFTIICEELGVFGMIVVLVLFGYLLYRLFFIAWNAPDLYGSLMVCGIFFHIGLQVILNIAVAVNLIPTTGITLPFFSYGGTSVIFLMLELAIALSVSRGIRFKGDKVWERKPRASRNSIKVK